MRRQTVFLLVGCPASGKSSWARSEASKVSNLGNNAAHISRDNIRFQLVSEDEPYFSKEKEVYKEFIQCLQEMIDSGTPYIYADATHLTKKSRETLLNKLNYKDVDIIPVVFTTPLGVCLTRNNQRQGRAKVPEEAVINMYNTFSDPFNDDNNKYAQIWYVNEYNLIDGVIIY